MPDLKTREPVQWLNYRGRVSIEPGSPMGPNLMGEYLWPVVAEYDPETDTTRVGLSFIAPPTEATS
jgi:hypothetical protein